MKMIDSDWIEMAQMAESNTIAAGGLLITMISGYLVVAYLVGAKLSRVQVTSVNILYVVGTMSVNGSVWSNTYDNMLARHHAYTYIPDLLGSVPAAQLVLIPLGVALMYVCIIITSLFFMWSIRHPKTE